MPDIYPTGDEIFTAAMDLLPMASSGNWPDTTSRKNIINMGLIEAQRKTKYYRRRERKAFTTPWTSVDLFTTTEPHKGPEMVDLLAAWSVTGGDFSVSDRPLRVISIDDLRAFREHTPATAITAFSDYGATVSGTVKATCTAHGLQDENVVTIAGNASYNGTYVVNRVDANGFYFRATFVATGTARWSLVENPVFALNPYPYRSPTELGKMVVEAYPAFSQNTTVEFLWAEAPPLVSDMTSRVYMPFDVMVKYVAWYLSISRAEGKTNYFMALFERACAEVVRGLGDSGTVDLGSIPMLQTVEAA